MEKQIIWKPDAYIDWAKWPKWTQLWIIDLEMAQLTKATYIKINYIMPCISQIKYQNGMLNTWY